VTHTVQLGESPWSIATDYGITAEALMIANQISDPASLQVGQQLFIPADTIRPSANQTRIYRIESGDTLFSLAAKYGSTVDDILAANPGLEPTALQVGQNIVIPLTAPEEIPATPTPIAADIPGPDTVSLPQQVVDATNAQREQQGLSPLVPDEQLSTVAQAHAQDMVNRDYFDHVTPEGKTLRNRLSEQGLALNWVGENIQRNTEPAERTVQSAIDWFMTSPPHRANILHPQFSHIGVGVVEESGWFTFVLVFAEK
jgi:uncharacterized protein YkwD